MLKDMPVYPISFSIPEEKISQRVPEKTKRFAHIVPGDPSTYIFQDETTYYADYQQSIFGRTQKKAGWDCLRHYEILANGCIPWFRDLDRCPAQTMVHLPKQRILDAMQSETPEAFIPELLTYTRTHLTCRAMAQYVFDTVGCPTPKRVLFLSGDPYPDYLRCLTLIGMKQILGSQCIESVGVPHLYEDYPTPSGLYGKGFTYSRVLPISAKPQIHDLRNERFDLVVYGSLHRGMPHWDEVLRRYPPHQIVALCGEDCDDGSSTHTCTTGRALSDLGVHVFLRELS